MFWDSSAIVPLLLPEPKSTELASFLELDAEPVLWWGSPVECHSALYRRHRDEPLSADRLAEALTRLNVLLEDLDIIAPTDRVRERAQRLLANHPLRAADSLQLAAALTWCEEQPTGETVVCLDDRLRDAARREGFKVVPD